MGESNVRARVIKSPITVEKSQQSQQIYKDDFEKDYRNSGIIEPEYNIKELKLMGDYSSILQQCIDAYKTNIIEFGIEPEYKIDINAEDIEPSVKRQAEEEHTRLDEVVRYANMDDSPEVVLGYAIDDREKTGNGYIEVIRNLRNEPSGIEYVDTQYMRICKKTERTPVEYTITENGVEVTETREKKFRKYVQMIDGKKVYFKEYGDPRTMDMATGEFGDSIPEYRQANEIVHLKIGSGTYGKPRWIGTLISLYGARKAEELNLMYFKNGRHVPAAITVSNGKLDDESYAKLQEYMNDIEGTENAHKFLLLEVEGTSEEDSMGETKTTPAKVEIKSMAEILQKDALFLEYDERTRKKIRSAFRLPPLYTGEAHEFSRASADTARKVTEEQVFQPERKGLARILNTVFLGPLKLKYVKLAVRGADFRDPIEIAKALYPLITAGAIAPNDLRPLAAQVLGQKLDVFGDEYNVPFQMLMKGQELASDPNDPFSGLLDIQKSRSKQNTELVDLLKDMRDVLEGLQS